MSSDSRSPSGVMKRQPFAIGRITQWITGFETLRLPRLNRTMGSGVYWSIPNVSRCVGDSSSSIPTTERLEGSRVLSSLLAANGPAVVRQIAKRRRAALSSRAAGLDLIDLAPRTRASSPAGLSRVPESRRRPGRAWPLPPGGPSA